MATKLNLRDIPEPVQRILWGRAAGRCQRRGCNKPLWKSDVSQDEISIAQKAHIYSVSDDGPRGNKGIAKEDLNKSSNLMLVCHPCHQEFDRNNGADFSAEFLRNSKAEHEERVERVTGIDPGRKSRIVLFSRNIGDSRNPVSYEAAASALLSEKRHPDSDRPIALETKNSEWSDRDKTFWRLEEEALERQFSRLVGPQLADGELQHLSAFALAPMPLLVKFGSLLTDIPEVEVFQLHREPKGWSWPDTGTTLGLELERPTAVGGDAALVLSMSATIDEARVTAVLGEEVPVWHLRLPHPTQECIRSRAALKEFSEVVRPLMNEIKAAHGQDAVLHIFPAAPVSVMVELGRLRQPKADLRWEVYDQVNARGGFVPAISILTQ